MDKMVRKSEEWFSSDIAVNLRASSGNSLVGATSREC